MSGHYCRSDRLTVSTVAATVPVAAIVTVYLVKATATATAMDTQMTYRDKKRLGPPAALREPLASHMANTTTAFLVQHQTTI